MYCQVYFSINQLYFTSTAYFKYWALHANRNIIRENQADAFLIKSVFKIFTALNILTDNNEKFQS